MWHDIAYMWNLRKGYKWTYLQKSKSHKCRKQAYCYQGVRVGRDKLGDWATVHEVVRTSSRGVPSPRDLPNSWIKAMSLASPALEGRFFTTAPLMKPINTLLYIKQITNKDLLYSTKISTQYSIIAHMGKDSKNEWIYV